MNIRRLMAGDLPFSMALFNVEGAGGGVGGEGAAPDAGGGVPAPESVLFPDEGKDKEGDQQNGEGDKSGDKPEGDGDDDKKEGDDPADKVPEDGKYDLKMPDGVEIDEELASALGPEFAELGLTNKQAQKLVDKYIETQQKRAEVQVRDWHKTVNGWKEEAENDPEIGGAKWESSKSSAIRAVRALGTPELREYLEWSGGGNHPEVIRFMAKVGAMIKEDNPAGGGTEGAGKPADPAHILFPNDVPKG